MKTFIVGNWKMNPENLAKAKEIFNSISKKIKNFKNKEVVICPPFVYLTEFLTKRKNNQKIKFGAQDCFWENSGAFTGEISSIMLKNLGCDYVILGHSERRQILKETDEMINKKISATIKANLKPILCIGETEKERKDGKTFEVIKNQLQEDLKGKENWKMKIENLIIAYEPIWAIGTGNACQASEAKEVLLFLRKELKKNYILYGGSVNSQNAKDYLKAGFNGLLVGGASLKPDEFAKIVHSN